MFDPCCMVFSILLDVYFYLLYFDAIINGIILLISFRSLTTSSQMPCCGEREAEKEREREKGERDMYTCCHNITDFLFDFWSFSFTELLYQFFLLAFHE